ncbi:MAG: bifunctional homocysteine S-methyltransferase/methylenetetrahydrofolate reductase [Candidatus Dormibacterales bacterium]
MDPFTSLLRRGPLLFDGAMGTELLARGADPAGCLEELNLKSPSLVRAVHRDYVDAGADVIETNTFGANRFRLGEHYLEGKVGEINRAGARLAVEVRNACGRPVLVAGSIGPLGKTLEPIGAVKLSSAERIFREQARALKEGGADLLVLETFTSPAELELAARACADETGLPLIAEMSDDDASSQSDAAARALVEALAPISPVAVGVNCGSGPEAAIAAARRLAQAGAPAVSAMPNAGLPHREAGRLVYTAGPEYFAGAVPELLAAGATILGGCCGTTPQHTRAMRAALDRARPGAVAVRPVRPRYVEEEERPAPPTRLAAALGRKEFVVSVELTPPRGVDPRRMLAGARLLKEAGVDHANITDSAMARLRMGVLSCASLVQQQVGLDPIAHYTTRDRNVMAIQSELIGAHALGIRNVLCLRGDAPRVGDYPNATAVWDVNAVGLITILANLNRGLDANGSPIGERAAFFIGAAVNPNAADLDREIRLMRRKVEAGAGFLVTQPIYESGVLERFLERAGEVSAPVMVGVMPLLSARHAEYLHNEVPGIHVPEAVRARVQEAGEGAARLGVEMAVAFLESARSLVEGAYVIPASGRYDLAAEVVTRTRAAVR